MNLASLNQLRLRIKTPKRPLRNRSQYHVHLKHRIRGDRQQIEFLARETDTVIDETVSGGRVRRFRLGHGKAHEYAPFWHDLMLRCIGVLDDWRESRRWKREIRRRQERHAKMREVMERRLRGPAFVCRLPSDSLR
jgi:hypothetical protein